MKSFVFFALSLGVGAALADTVTGSTSGVWTSPSPTSGTYTGTGTPTFIWGVPLPGSVNNELIFTPVSSFSSMTETPFKVGTVFYQNGSSSSGVASNVNLSLSMNFGQPGLNPVTGSYGFHITSTDNTSDPIASADYLSLPTVFSSTSFVIGATTYTVKLVGFQNVIGDGFLSSSTTELHVEEQRHASADLYAEVTSQVAAVPEPGVYAMMLAGLAGLTLTARRRRS